MLTAAKTHGKLKEMQKSWLIQSEQEMIMFGRHLGERTRQGDLFFLFGDLGSGKTTLTKGIALGLGITALVNSPTFQILKSYQGRILLYHLDLYRLEKVAELAILEPELLLEQGVVVVEWGDIWLTAMKPAGYLEIQLTTGPDPTQRRLELIPHGPEYQILIEDLPNVRTGY